MFLQTAGIKSAEDFEKHFHNDLWREAAEHICRRHHIAFDTLSRSPQGENIVFFADEKFIVKIYAPFRRRGYAREKAALEFVPGKTSLKLPELLYAGEIEGFDYLVMTQLRGAGIARHEWLKLDVKDQIIISAQLAAGLKELHSHNPDVIGADAIGFDWKDFIDNQAKTCLERQRAANANPEWLEVLPAYLEENLPLLPNFPAPVFLHGDVHFGNLLVRKEKGNWVISGLFDLGDSLTGFHEYEFVAPGVLMIQGQGEIQREFFRAYGYKDNEIDETLRRRLMLLTILYECSDLRKYALRLKPEAVDFTLAELEKAIWSL